MSLSLVLFNDEKKNVSKDCFKGKTQKKTQKPVHHMILPIQIVFFLLNWSMRHNISIQFAKMLNFLIKYHILNR